MLIYINYSLNETMPLVDFRDVAPGYRQHFFINLVSIPKVFEDCLKQNTRFSNFCLAC